MDIIKLFEDYQINYSTANQSKNVSSGWIGVRCPFCADQSDHLGYNLSHNYFRCWKCGKHNKVEVICRLLNVDESTAKRLLYDYKGNSDVTFRPETKTKPRLKPFKYPSSTGKMLETHKRYLEKRNFDATFLEEEWGLLGTGPAAVLDKKDYKLRVIIPIYWEGKVVSFQGRAITKNAFLRYKTCPIERERIHHKHILYIHPETLAKPPETLIVVEGVTDVWRLGKNAVATFGIEFKEEQVRCLVKLSKNICILFDNEPQAQRQAKLLEAKLKMYGKKVWRTQVIGSDAGDLTAEQAEAVVENILKR